MSITRRVLLAVANGFEEVEMTGPFDILKRAGAEVTLVSANPSVSTEVISARNLKILADKHISQIESAQPYDLILVPGGLPNAQTLGQSQQLVELYNQQKHKQKGNIFNYYAAICASPVFVLEKNNLIDKQQQATSYPSLTDQLADQSRVQERVVVSGNMITSQGPGTSLEFGLCLVELLYGTEVRDKLKSDMLI